MILLIFSIFHNILRLVPRHKLSKALKCIPGWHCLRADFWCIQVNRIWASLLNWPAALVEMWLGSCCASPETAAPTCSCRTSIGNIHRWFALLCVQNHHDLDLRSVQSHFCPEHERGQWYALVRDIFDPHCIKQLPDSLHSC